MFKLGPQIPNVILTQLCNNKFGEKFRTFSKRPIDIRFPMSDG